MGEEQALQGLHDILARPEYQAQTSVPWWQQLLAPVLEQVWSLLSQLFDTVGQIVSGQSGAYGWVVVGACLLLFVVVAVYLLRAARLAMVSEHRLVSVDLAQRRERSDRLWQAAQDLAAAGRFAEAVPLVYLSALYALDERALLHIESSLTNREHARQLTRLNPTMGRTFEHVVYEYDRFRYGHAPVVAESFGEFSRAAGLVRRGPA